MKRFVPIIVVLAFMIFCIADSIRGFLSADGFRYFSEQPHRLLLIGVIGIVGGLTALGLSVLSQRLRRTLKLIALALGGKPCSAGSGLLRLTIGEVATGASFGYPAAHRFVHFCMHHLYRWVALV